MQGCQDGRGPARHPAGAVDRREGCAIKLAICTALASALAFAVGTVLEHRGATLAPKGRGALRLCAHLARRPVWLVGIAMSLTALGLHVVALRWGRLSVVQPVLVTGLLFALPLSRLVERRRVQAAEWVWACAVVVGLGVFLGFARPGGGAALPDRDAFAVASLVALLLAAGCAVRATFTRRHRAALLGTAAGMAFGVTAALIKYVVELARHDPLHLLTMWPGYALVVVGGSGLLLVQAAYSAGPLAASLPAITIADPVVAIAIGALAGGELPADEPLAVLLQGAGVLLMAVGVAQLSRRVAPALPDALGHRPAAAPG